MKRAALWMLFVFAIIGKSAEAEKAPSLKHIALLIKHVDDDNAALNFSDFPIDRAHTSTFFNALKNMPISEVKIVSLTDDAVVFRGTIATSQQGMTVEITIMSHGYSRAIAQPLVGTTGSRAAEKTLAQVQSEVYLTTNPVLPIEKLHTKENIHAVVGNFAEPPLLSFSDVQGRNRQQQDVINALLTREGQETRGIEQIYHLSEQDKLALSDLDFSIAIGVPELSLSAFAKKIDRRLADTLDILDVKDAMLIYSTRRYHHPNLKRDIEVGLNLTALIKTKQIKHEAISSSQKLIAKYTRLSGLDTFIVHGVIIPEIIGSTLIIDVPGKITIGKKIESKGIRLRAQIVDENYRIMMSVIGTYLVKVRPQDYRITGSLNLSPPSIVTLTGEVVGVWNNPFGIPALALEDVAVEVGTDFELVAASEGAIPISILGGRARILFPKGRLELALFLSLTEEERMLIYGDFDGSLTLKDIIGLSIKMHAEEKRLQAQMIASIEDKIMKHVPDFSLHNVRVHVSPVHRIIANKEYHKGVSIKAHLDIWDDEILFESKISPKGIHALAYIPEFSIGPLHVKGSQFLSDHDNNYSLATVSKLNASSGPIIYVDINPREEKSEFFVDGAIESTILGGIHADARVYLEKSGARLQIKERLGDVFESTLDFTTRNHKDSSDLKLRGSFSQQALYVLTHKIVEKAQAVKSDVLANTLARLENQLAFTHIAFQADKEGMEDNELSVDVHATLTNNKFELTGLQLDFDDVKDCVDEIYEALQEKLEEQLETAHSLNHREARSEIANDMKVIGTIDI